MSNPFFSVIITTYDRPDKLLLAINSVLSQEFQDFEIIIVNDGSTISYQEVLQQIEGNDQIKYYYKINEERSVARNFAIAKANGTWMCFLDDDDIFYSNHLISRYNAIQEEKSINVFFCSPSVMRFADGRTEKAALPHKQYKGIDILIYDLIMVRGVCFYSVIAKKHLFNPELSYWEDFEYWMRIILKENLKIHVINEYTSEYIFHDANSVSTWSSKLFLNKIKTFEFLKINYSTVLPDRFLKEKIYDACLGLADCYAREKKRKLSITYIKKGLRYKADLSAIRPILGIIKNLIKR